MKCSMESITHIEQIMKIAHRINSGNIVTMIVQKMKMTIQNKNLITINIKKKALEIIINRFEDKEDFGTVTLRDEGDIVRNPLIKTIEDIFDQIEENK